MIITLTQFQRVIQFAAKISVSSCRRFSLASTLAVMCMLPVHAAAAVIINEFMVSNDTTLADEDGQFSDWIELYNNGGSSVDISNWYLTDDQSELTQWQFPSTTIAAGEYLVVFASGKDRAVSGNELHTNFKLSSGGEYLALVLADGLTTADAYSPEYPQQFTDISYAGNQYFDQPTPGSQNNAGVDGVLEPVEFSLAHGFYNATQTLNLTTSAANAEIRYTLDGSTPSSQTGCTPPADGSAWAYEYYEGEWSVLPNFDALTPVTTGTANTISVAPKQREEFYGLRFKGCIEVTRAGLYRFSTSSDDGSQLFINNQLVVDNDGLHGVQTVTNSLILDKGLHSVTVTMFERTGGDQLSAHWSSPTRSNAYISSADNGRFITDPLTSPNNQNLIEFEFDLTTSGQFSFDTRVQGVNDNSNSFWVQLDNGPLWEFDTTISSTITNQMLSDRTAGVIAQSLSAGEHTLRFYMREDGSILDSVTVLGTNCDGPCETQVLEAEAAAVSGEFYAAGSTTEPLKASSWLTYSNPITINATTTVRAVAVKDNYLRANPVTQSYLFVNDIISQSSNGQAPAGWPTGPVNNQILDYGMDPEIVNASPQAVRDSLTSLPAVSLVTDLDHLFHPDLGIYVNAQNKGRYWERPTSVELIDPQGLEPGFTKDAGMRMRGGFSRSGNNPKHAFRLFFRGSYAGDLEYPLFGNEGTDIFEKVDLRTPQNYSWSFRGDNRNTFLREVWSRDTQGAMGHVYTKSRYYHLYINGVYWGIFMSQERVSKEFASSYFGGDEDNFDVVKHNRSDNFRYEATDGTNSAWNSIWNYVADQQISAGEFEIIKQNVDLNSLIDYIMINAYEGDTDGSPSAFLSSFKRSNNWYAIFDRTNPDTKWTFYQHDGEHSLGVRRLPDLEENLLGPYPPYNGQNNEFFFKDYFNPYWLHAALEKNADYRQLFIDRSALHFSSDGALSTTQALSRWNSRKQQVSAAILSESARWGDAKSATPFTVNDWQNEVNFAENSFFSSRSGIVFNQLVEKGLASQIPTPELPVPSGTTVTPGTQIVLGNNYRYLRLMKSGNNPGGDALNLAEVEVIDTTGVNRALTGSASLSGTLSPYSADICINGVTGGEFCHSDTATGNDWWQVDLGSQYAIGEIRLFNRDDCCQDRLSNVYVLMSDTPFPANTNLIESLAIADYQFQIGGVSAGNPDRSIIFNNSVAYYTLDGSDPRLPGGGISPNAIMLLPGQSITINGDVTITIRYYDGGNWGPISEWHYTTNIIPVIDPIQDQINTTGETINLALTATDDDVLFWSATNLPNGLTIDSSSGEVVGTINDLGLFNVTVSVNDGTVTTDTSFAWWVVPQARLALNEYNAVSGSKYLGGGDNSVSEPADSRLGRIQGNGGDWFELVVIEDHLDIRGWQLSIVDNGGGAQILNFSNSNIWSDLRAGTLITVSENPITTASGAVIDEDIGYSPANNDWWINVVSGNAGSGQYITAQDISVSNDNWQIQILDNNGQSVFGPVGEGIGQFSGVNSEEVGKLESDPQPYINPGSNYDDGTSSTFGSENSFNGGTQTQDFSALRSVLSNDINLSVADISASEDAGQAIVTVSISQAASDDVSFQFTTSNGNAIAGQDYVAQNNIQTINAGEVQIEIPVTLINDLEIEIDEQFNIVLSNAVNAIITDGNATVTIMDDDTGIALPILSVSDTSVTEGRYAQFNLSLSEPSLQPVSFTINTVAGTADANTDFTSRTGTRSFCSR